MQEYDIIVIGAGPAGLSAAYKAASNNARVLMIEKDDGVGVNVRTSGVTWIDYMDRFGIDSKYYNKIKNFRFYSPNNEIAIEDKYARCCVLDVRKAYQYLAEKALNAGADIMLKTQALKVVKDHGKIHIKAKRLDHTLEFKARLLIDASGFNAIVRRNIHSKAWRRYGVGVEYECYVEHIDKDTWHLMVGSIYSPAGYAWIFPLNEHKARIGVGIGRPESNYDPMRLLDDMLKHKPKPLDRLGLIKPLELHYGFIPNEGLIDEVVDDNIIIVGDAAGIANPLVLEGIRYAIEFGMLAGEVGAKALPYCDKEALKPYQDACNKVRKKIDNALRVQRRWLRLDDKGWDEELDIIKDMSIDELLDFIRADFSLQRMLKLAISHPKIIARELFRSVIE